MSNLKINMNSIEDVKNSLNSHTLRVCVIGIGRIGLPTVLVPDDFQKYKTWS